MTHTGLRWLLDTLPLFWNGLEYSPTGEMFTNLRDPRTEEYLSGRFG